MNRDGRASLWGRALAGRVVAIVRVTGTAPLVDVAEALVEGGIRALEFTLTSPRALEAIEHCRARFGDGVVIGAGTVLEVTEAHRCLDAGAQFLRVLLLTYHPHARPAPPTKAGVAPTRPRVLFGVAIDTTGTGRAER